MFRTKFDQENKQWNGVKTKSDFNPDTSLGNVILNSLRVYGSKVALICANTGKTTTFDDLHALTIRAAKHLKNFGFQNGQVIFLLTNNTDDIVSLVFAVLCLGCQISCLPTVCSESEYEYFLSLMNPHFVFCDLKLQPILKKCLENLKSNAKFFTFDGQNNESIAVKTLFDVEQDTHFEPAEINGTIDIAFITRSSGSTGMPKGVRISHAYILDNVRRLSAYIRSTDVLLAPASLDGINGIRVIMAGTINGSTRIVNEGNFSPERFFALVERFKVTYTLSAPFRAVELLNHPQIKTADLRSIKYYTCGGSGASFDTIRTISKYLTGGKLCHSFGMTELVGPVAINFNHTRNECVGQLISGCSVKIVNEEGERLGVGEVGEFCIKQPYLFSGYLGDNRNLQDYFDSEGFFITGDIARFDENGDLFIVDRKKEMFKCEGYHVTPTEIEVFLNQMEGVRQSCVVPIPNEKFEYLPAVLIVKSEHSTCSERTISEAVSNYFAYYKRLRGGVFFVDSIPMTVSGKIARNSAKQMAIHLINS